MRIARASQFHPATRPGCPLSRVRYQAINRWPKALLAAWKCAVRADLATHPFSELDFAAFRTRPPCSSRHGIAHQRLPGLRATLSPWRSHAVTFSIPSWRWRHPDRSRGRRRLASLAETARVYGEPDRVALFPPSVAGISNPGGCPARAHAGLITLSTDGYANCFDDDVSFYKVGTDFLSYLRSKGVDFVGKNLGEWLRQSSHDGSGDDITVGLAARTNALPVSARPGNGSS